MTDDEILAFKIGDNSIGENLQRAIERGAVRRRDDGNLQLNRPQKDLFLHIRPMPTLGCDFLNRFMFRQVYAKAAVPIRCEACYKIKVDLRSLRELVAAYEAATEIHCLSKWGIDIENQYNQSIYAGYFYISGLETARALFLQIRKMVDEHPKLGAGTPVVIKRGCSNFEAALGPSGNYTFQPEQHEIEAYFKSRFRSFTVPKETVATMLYENWVPFAYRIGDDTYLDFTNGKPLYPKSVSYAP